MGPGFDCFGVALKLVSDRLTFVERAQKHITFEFSGFAQDLPCDSKKNAASVALEALLQACKIKTRCFHLKLHKNFATGSGLGSSAASSAAAVFAANELLKLGMSRAQLVCFAAVGEAAVSGVAHADNVAPSLLGCCVLLQSHLPLCAVHIPFPQQWQFVIMQPHFELDTRKARAVLPKQVPLALAVQQQANFASMIAALFAGESGLFGRALKDVMVEPARAKMIPHFRLLQDEACKAGALAGSIAGAGPASFVVVESKASAQKVKKHLEKVIAKKKLKYSVLMTSVSDEGVQGVK